MKPDYLKLIKEYNSHGILLDQEGLINAMDICFEKGKIEGVSQVLKWLSNSSYLSDNIKYIIEEWENQNS